jgi:hypothetical protein
MLLARPDVVDLDIKAELVLGFALGGRTLALVIDGGANGRIGVVLAGAHLKASSKVIGLGWLGTPSRTRRVRA